jgi:hypothetical protein
VKPSICGLAPPGGGFGEPAALRRIHRRAVDSANRPCRFSDECGASTPAVSSSRDSNTALGTLPSCPGRAAARLYTRAHALVRL